MQHLEYENVPPTDWLTPTFLIGSLLVAWPITIFVNFWWINEPFMSVRVVDLAVFFGAPLALAALAALWLALARRRQLSWLLIVPALCWFAGNIYFALQRLPVYFREGWNY
jgi:hypothetical protein